GPSIRIVSQTVLSDEILWKLGPETQDHVVAVSKMADDPRYSSVANLWPSKVQRLSVAAESLLALSPDLIIIASFSSPEIRELLRRNGIQTIVLDQFTDFSDFRQHTRSIAHAVGADERAERLIAQFDARLANIQSLE